MELDSLRPLTASHQRAMEAAVDQYARNVTVAQEWLAARGIEDASVVTYRLGVVDEPIPGHERYKGMLCIPYLDQFTRVTQVRFRCLQDHDCKERFHGKYETMPGDPSRIWNIGAFASFGDVLHVTEGEFDAMILSQLGFNAVGCPGVSTWKPRHTVGARGFNAVYVWGDGDRAGREFNAQMYQTLPNARLISMPDGHDITSLHQSEGAESVRERFEESHRLYGGV